MKEKYIVLLLFCGLLCCPQFVWAKAEQQPLDISCFDIEYCCEQYTKNDDVYHFTYEDGTFNIQQNEKYHFLILDGQYLQVPIKIIKDKAFVPLSALTDSMDCTIEQKGDTLFLVRKGQKLPISSKDGQIDENKMLGLRDVMEALGATVTYTRKGIMPLENPLIAVDFRESSYTKEQAEQKVQTVLLSCMKTAREAGKIVPSDMEYRIAKTEVVADIAGYYVLEGICTMLLEKSTGAVYMKMQSQESICMTKIQTNDV